MSHGDLSTWILGLIVVFLAMLLIFGSRWDSSAEAHFRNVTNFLLGFLVFSMWTMGSSDLPSRMYQATLFAAALGFGGLYFRERFRKRPKST
jgi:hypothetical protein